jgi:hypothetical protein
MSTDEFERLARGFSVAVRSVWVEDSHGREIAGFSFALRPGRPTPPKLDVSVVGQLDAAVLDALLRAAMGLAREQQPVSVSRVTAKQDLAALAQIDRSLAESCGRQAELFAQRARVQDSLSSGRGVDLTNARRVPRPHVPTLPDSSNLSELDRERAKAALRNRRRQ